jgi:hypothetical protein
MIASVTLNVFQGPAGWLPGRVEDWTPDQVRGDDLHLGQAGFPASLYRFAGGSACTGAVLALPCPISASAAITAAAPSMILIPGTDFPSPKADT